MRKKAFGANSPLATAPVAFPGPDICALSWLEKIPSVRPAPTAPTTLRNVRRSTESSSADCKRSGFIANSLCEIARCFFDRGANAHIGCATADVPAHRGIDVRVGRALFLRQQ